MSIFPWRHPLTILPLLQVWPMRGYPLLLNSNNDSARSGAFRAAMAARRTTSTGLTLVGSDWIARGITRVATMLVTPLYWDPVKRKGVQVTQQQVEQQPRQQQCQQPPPSASAAAAGGGPPTRSEPILTGFLDINFAWTSVRHSSHRTGQIARPACMRLGRRLLLQPSLPSRRSSAPPRLPSATSKSSSSRRPRT